MKVLVISNMYPSAEQPAFGIFVERIAEQLAENGASVDRVVRFDRGNKVIGYLSFYLKSFLAVLFSRHDLVYLHFPSHSYLGAALALLVRDLPLVTHVHGADVAPDKAGRAREKLIRWVTGHCLRRSTMVIAPSRYFAALVASIFPDVRKKLQVSPSGGVDVRRLRYQVPTTGAKLRFLFLGRLINGKGVHLMIEAAELLEQDDPGLEFELVFAGDGPERGNLERGAGGLAQASAQFLGGIDPHAVAATIAACDVLVFPSHRKGESLGLVALEAMSCGRPVIAARNGAMEEIINDREQGWLFAAGDAQQLAAAMRLALQADQEQIQRMSLAARARAELYSGDVVGRALAMLFRNVIGGRRADADVD
ncbi:glycosyltransferase [Luteimonas sp. FCS-9]|uniref:glycosyltransferase n=1 Tax=Luteimonas sp. FCS-9 TaxID=1547516 RepID=UPI0009E4BBAB|nr:glycosyltransferase [Luteimonas sp. FCS-9]